MFPREAWARALAEAARPFPGGLGLRRRRGHTSLREETADYLYRSKGLRAAPDEVFITAGCSQTLGLVSRALLRGARRAGSSQARYGRAVLENPCQPALSGLLAREGVELVAGRVDAEGLDPGSLPRDKARGRLRHAVASVSPRSGPFGSAEGRPHRMGALDRFGHRRGRFRRGVPLRRPAARAAQGTGPVARRLRRVLQQILQPRDCAWATRSCRRPSARPGAAIASSPTSTAAPSPRPRWPPSWLRARSSGTSGV